MIDPGALDLVHALASDQTTNALLVVFLWFNQKYLRRIVDRLDQRLASVEDGRQEHTQRLTVLETWKELHE